MTIGENEVWLDEFNRWASPLADGIGARVGGESERRCSARRESTLLAQSTGGDADFRVTIEVQRFESAPGSYAMLDAVYSVRRSVDGRTATRPNDRSRKRRRTRATMRSPPPTAARWPACASDVADGSAARLFRRASARRPFSRALIRRHSYARLHRQPASMRNLFDLKRNPQLAWTGLRADRRRAAGAAVRAGLDRHRVGAHHQPRDPVRIPGARPQHRGRLRRPARPRLHRVLRGRRLRVRAPGEPAFQSSPAVLAASCRWARRSPASSACCSARRRSSCAATTSPSSRWASARSSASSSTTCRSRSTSPTGRRASR